MKLKFSVLSCVVLLCCFRCNSYSVLRMICTDVNNCTKGGNTKSSGPAESEPVTLQNDDANSALRRSPSIPSSAGR